MTKAYKAFKSVIYIILGASIAIGLNMYNNVKLRRLQEKEQQENIMKQQRIQKMKLAWQQQQEKHRAPKVIITEDLSKDILKSKIIEDSDDLKDDSDYDLLDSKSRESNEKEELALDADLDLNEMNFNLVKNSNSFKPMSLSKQKSVQSKEMEEMVDFDLESTNFSSKKTIGMFGHRISEEDTNHKYI